MAPKRDLAAAKLRRQGIDPDLLPVIENLLADKEHAEKLALLAAKAGARGAAPAPPGKGGAAPSSSSAAPSAPASVSKMRAVQAYSGEVTFEKGATVFVVGDADSDGFFQTVAGGKTGKAPKTHLREITDDLLKEEREQRQLELEESRKKEELRLQQEMEEETKKIEAKYAAPAAAGAAAPAKSDELDAHKREVELKFKAELLSEEQRLKAEAARLEELMRQLDADDD